MKILVAPLNWGLGHAARCIPLIRNYVSQGHEVVIGGDGESLDYLKAYFPSLRVIELPNLYLTYSSGSSQVWAMFRQLPHLFQWKRRDTKAVRHIQQSEHFDIIISDNRFGLHTRNTRSVYITHQLHICLPRGWRWLEPVAELWHRHIIENYDECWVPDNAEFPSLGGILSHPATIPRNAIYIGSLSRFECRYQIGNLELGIRNFSSTDLTNLSDCCASERIAGKRVAVLSGLEPQRSIFERQLREQYGENIFIINGKPPYPTDKQMAKYLSEADEIISRSGYSSVMDYAALGVLDKANMVATPGQPEQEYLAELHNSQKKSNFAG